MPGSTIAWRGILGLWGKVLRKGGGSKQRHAKIEEAICSCFPQNLTFPCYPGTWRHLETPPSSLIAKAMNPSFPHAHANYVHMQLYSSPGEPGSTSVLTTYWVGWTCMYSWNIDTESQGSHAWEGHTKVVTEKTRLIVAVTVSHYWQHPMGGNQPICSFASSFIQYLFNTHYMLGTVLCSWDTLMDQTDKSVSSGSWCFSYNGKQLIWNLGSLSQRQEEIGELSLIVSSSTRGGCPPARTASPVVKAGVCAAAGISHNTTWPCAPGCIPYHSPDLSGSAYLRAWEPIFVSR